MEVCRLVSDGRFQGHHRPQTDQRTAFVPDGRLPAPLGISRRRRQAPGTGRFRVGGPGATADLRRRMEGRSLRSPRYARTQPAQSARRIRGRRNAQLSLPRGLRPGHQRHDPAGRKTLCQLPRHRAAPGAPYRISPTSRYTSRHSSRGGNTGRAGARRVRNTR